MDLSKMKKTGCQYCICLASQHRIDAVFNGACTATCNNRNGDQLVHLREQLKVKTRFGAIPVHAAQKNFTGSPLLSFCNPLHRIQARKLAAALYIHTPRSEE